MTNHPYTDKFCDDIFTIVVNPKGQVLVEFHKDEVDKEIIMHFTGWMNQEIYTQEVDRDIRTMLSDDYGIEPKTITKLGINIFKAGRHDKKVHYYTTEWNLDNENITFNKHLWLYPKEIHAYSKKHNIPLGRGFIKGLALLKIFTKERARKEPYLKKNFTKTGIYQLNNGDLVAITKISEYGELRDYNRKDKGLFGGSIWDADGVMRNEDCHIEQHYNIFRFICDLPFQPKVCDV